MKKYFIKNRCWFAGALVFVLFSTICAVILQFFKGKVLDHAVSGNISSSVRYAVILFAFIILEIMFFYLYKRFYARYVAGCIRGLKQDIWDSILSRSYIAFTENSDGAYIARCTTTAETIKERHFSMQLMLWDILFRIILVSTALFWLDWCIALITIVLLTTPLYLPKLIEKKLQSAQSKHIEATERQLAKISGWLAAFELIKNFSIERKISFLFKDVNDATTEKLLKESKLSDLAQLITTLISYLSYFVVLACATVLVLKGKFTAGDFFISIGMIDQLSYPLISLAGIIRHLIAIKPTCREMDNFLAITREAQNSDIQHFNTSIEFRHVNFSYNGMKDVLKSLNLKIEKGGRYLIKGPSGSGKTSLLNLLLRYYNACSGCISIDGKPIENFDSTYGLITILRQDAILFNDTLRNNLTMYRDIPDDKLIEILKSINLEKFASSEMLNCIISEGGANLSGGEKKRICLARALLRNTEVLVLDEPLANLDQETAENIENLLLAINSRTMIIVSHQFSESKIHNFDEVISLS